MEGFVSNLFVVQQSDTGLIVRTAVDRALPGIAQREVLDACQALHIVTDCNAPLRHERHLWVEAFLTNAIRGIRPIRRIMCPSKNAIDWDLWVVDLPAVTDTSVSCQVQSYLHRRPQDSLSCM